MRVAVVDIGTNSTRLLVADVDDGALTEVERRTEVTRLGQGVDRDGVLSEEAMERVLAAVGGYRRRIDLHGAERAVAVLTSAVRDAANGAQFAARIRDEHRLDARVIDGDEEARLTFLGATSSRPADDPTPTVVIDIGGGSTELVMGSRRAVSFHVSTQVGVVRHSERHIHTDPPRAEEVEALAADVRATFAAAVPADVRARPRAAIAVAGTPTSLAAIDLDLECYSTNAVQGHVLTIGACQAMLERLAALPAAQRREVRGLHPDRAPTIVAGTAMLIEALGLFGLHQTEVSDQDILHGAALEAVRRARHGSAATAG
jgi:exopolyphosphatase / guanosine-5'-triphosphate,3'-diphosphate pyrophosphatase